MINKGLAAVFFCLISTIVFSQQSVTFIICSLPNPNSVDSNVFLAGSFNGWNPADMNFRFHQEENASLPASQGNLVLGIKLDKGRYEFKLTKGGWDKVECKKGGADIENRSLEISSDTTIKLMIDEWADKVSKKPRTSTASKNVHIIDTAFVIPQLGRTRKVWIYLPPSYATSGKKYPVLYMQDGQNVFDDATSFAGEWGVDETLDSISSHSKEMIVVAVDHGGTKRINEYCPYDMEKYGKGEGSQYVDFLVKTLKPFIDRQYRTLKNKQNTFVAGSSMGGLISMYAVLKYPGVFGGAGVFSPAFWVGPKIFEDIKAKGAKVNSRIYFYCGGQEGAAMQADMTKAFEMMRDISKSPMITCVRPDGKHSEAVWKEEFPLFYLWLMEK